ncbi:TRF5 [[Candida] subhashii]|uniref:polynucleotide adenylyltransferase n=1 Tax=[Candida] subhashii TaxID=561895 RepID=A0A8J5QCT1_9ASCO|nr:TRF5 [[Candida] subhashii]KAG7661077.1 TRF5 [[Candida] subhashii]
MGSKRKRDISEVSKASKKPKQKKPKKKKSKKFPTGSNSLELKENKFAKLGEHLEDDSDSSDYVFDYYKKEGSKESEIVLIDSDDEDDPVVVSSEEVANVDSGTEEVSNEGPQRKKQKVEENELAKQEDFIGFGFSSSDEEDDDKAKYEELSDDGILSADENGSVVHHQKKASYPWVKDHDHSKQKEIADWLTMEMKDFVNYISPSSKEITTRNTVVNKLKEKIAKFWPGTEAHVFGSCATDLYLPGSDIDMVVISETGDYENKSRLYQLSAFLRRHNLAKNIEVIAKAKVPIIKFVDPYSDLHIDISFERKNGLDAAKRIRRWLDSTPGLRELVLVVKQFLRSRRLNNVHVGGLGGYATIIMCYHFLHLHPKVSSGSIDILDNLGVLLIEFFELYGRNFSYDNLILAINTETEEPMYLLKSEHTSLSTRGAFAIVIQDPADRFNNITRGSYNLRDIKKAFGGAYQLLVEKCYQLNASTYKERLGQSILGDVIRYRGQERDFNDDRHKVVNIALINHEDDSQEESDGTGGNDKYYFSDMTVESDSEIVPPRAPTPLTNKAKDTKKLVESFLSLEHSDEESETKKDDNNNDDTAAKEKSAPKQPKSEVEKGIIRDYWRQKGLEF